MSALRYNTGKLLPLPRDEDMAFVGGAHARGPADAAWMQYLAANPGNARIMGHIVRRMGRNLKEAFPGETRDRSYSNADWRAAGYENVAAVNELLGLEGR